MLLRGRDVGPRGQERPEGTGWRWAPCGLPPAGGWRTGQEGASPGPGSRPADSRLSLPLDSVLDGGVKGYLRACTHVRTRCSV